MLTKFSLHPGTAPTRVVSGSGILSAELACLLAGSDKPTAVFVVCDDRVYRLHQRPLRTAVPKSAQWFLFRSAESAKSETSLHRILTWLHRLHADRRSLLLAIGGGVVTDLAGLAASLYMRGIPYAAVPTTLVCQVDAAIGGKTAINFLGVKNIVGVFCAPRIVVCDHDFLTTLTEPQVRDGLVEAFKIFCVHDSHLWRRFTQTSSPRAAAADFHRLIDAAVRLKTDIVNRDPFERDLRRILNFGHTAGHAYEALTGQSHGHSVAFGIQIALELSVRHAGLNEKDRDQCEAVFLALYSHFDFAGATPRRLWSKIQHDKKRQGDRIQFVLLKSCGNHRIRSVDYREFAAAVAAVKRRIA